MTSNARTPAQRRDIKALHERALVQVADAYLFHLISMHRRPVYRHRFGDIFLNQPSIIGFLDSHLEDSGRNTEQRWNWYVHILDFDAMLAEKKGGFIHWGNLPTLKQRGIGWIDCCFDQLGDIVQELGWEAAMKLCKQEGRR